MLQHLIRLSIMAVGTTLRPPPAAGRFAGEDDDEDAGDSIPDRLEGPRWARIIVRRLMLEMTFVLAFTSPSSFSASPASPSPTSCYFALCASPTGGLQQQLRGYDAEMLSTTLFLLIGIPILRAAMSRVVDCLIDR